MSIHKQIPLAQGFSDPRVFSGIVMLNLSNIDFELRAYRGFSMVIAEDRADRDFSVMAKKMPKAKHFGVFIAFSPQAAVTVARY